MEILKNLLLSNKQKVTSNERKVLTSKKTNERQATSKKFHLFLPFHYLPQLVKNQVWQKTWGHGTGVFLWILRNF